MTSLLLITVRKVADMMLMVLSSALLVPPLSVVTSSREGKIKKKNENIRVYENNNNVEKCRECENENKATTKDTLRRYECLCYYFIVSLASLLCYVNSISGRFVHDDIVAIVKNPDVTSDKPLLELFWNDFWGKSLLDPSSHKSYRPLCVLTFRYDDNGTRMTSELLSILVAHLALQLLFKKFKVLF